MRFLREHRVGTLIFLLALVARLLYFGISLHSHGGDVVKSIWAADGYYEVSKNMIAGNGFSSDDAPPYRPYSFRPPGYHYFIVGAYTLLGSYGGVILLQIVIGSLIPMLAMILSEYLTRSRSVVISVGVLLALEPYSILFSSLLYTETFFTFVFLLSVLCLFRYITYKNVSALLLSAFLLAVAVLIKPVAQYAPFFLLPILVWEAWGSVSKMFFLRVAGYALVFLLVLSPWLYRNYHTFGVIGISPQQGSALYTVLVPSVLAIENHTSFKEEFTTLLGTGVSGPNLTSVTQADEYTRLAIPILIRHPRGLILLSANTALNFFIHDGMLDVLRHIGVAPRERLGGPALFLLFSSPGELLTVIWHVALTPAILILFGRIAWVCITLAFFVGAVRHLRYERKSPHALVALSLVLYFMLTSLSVGFAISARYRMPISVFVFTFAMLGLPVIVRVIKRTSLMRYFSTVQ